MEKGKAKIWIQETVQGYQGYIISGLNTYGDPIGSRIALDNTLPTQLGLCVLEATNVCENDMKKCEIKLQLKIG